MAELATGEIPFQVAARPKLGLALSGGGFRTALFHIGVLLRLAELGILGAVEVISTVSGGSIVGAAYYLRLLARLREAGGAPLGNGDMVGIVAELASAFPEGVKQNVRVRAFSSYFRNLQMCQADYSRSDRVAALYDQLFLEGILEGTQPTRMRDLEQAISLPDGAPAEGRRPRLFINSTSLNTGRDWRFSAKTMGEPELQGQAGDIDRVVQFLSPPTYDDLPTHPADVPVSIAVAASSALPGGLHPMSISGMYERIRIQLTDGGVHDNQGVETLLGAGCTHFVVSDTGGQMASEEKARTSFLSVLLRAQQILYGRVRQEQLLRASERRPGEAAPSPLALIHLHKGVALSSVPPLQPGREATPNPAPAPASEPAPGGPSEMFGIDQRIMSLLAGVRTDLDSFSEVETKSLMSAGYLVAGHTVLDPGWAGSSFLSSAPSVAPDVIGRADIAGYLRHPTAEYRRQLKIASSRFLKVFRLYRPAWFVLLALFLAGLGAGVWAVVRFRAAGLPLGWCTVGVVVVGASIWVPTTTWGARAFDTQAATVLRWIRNAFVTAWLAAAWSNGYLTLFEPRFRRGGSLACAERGFPSRRSVPGAGSRV